MRGGGKLYGYNTDYVGVLRALRTRMPLRGSRVLIFGAGGAARAVAFALAQAGAAVCVYGAAAGSARGRSRSGRRRGDRAESRPRRIFRRDRECTPVGMHPAIGNSPLEARELNCRLVFDTIYRRA